MTGRQFHEMLAVAALCCIYCAQLAMCSNDHAPYFRGPLVATVSESLDIGAVVVALDPADDDDGVDGQTVVSLEDDPDGLFLVSEGGSVYLAASLDYETKSVHTIRVKVEDQSLTGAKSHQATVTVTVTNEIDAPPFCDEEIFVKTISEGPTIYKILRFSEICHDPEDEKNYAYPFRAKIISVEPTSDVYKVSYWSSRLSTTDALDYETDPTKYVLKVRLVTRLEPERTATSMVVVNLMDVDDEPVIWPNGNRFSITVPENANVYTSLIKTEASDDAPAIHYGIIKNPPGYTFAIGTTGDMYSLTAFDREDTDTMEVQIYAQDFEEKKPKLPAYVAITVTDVNDNAPVFGQFYYFKSVTEDEDFTNTPLVVAAATDGDEGINAEITYSIQEKGGGSSAPFSIHPLTGEVYSAGTYTKDKYSLLVTASDGGDPSFESSVSLDVVVRSSNNHNPRFTQSAYNISVTEDAGIGTTVTTISASDKDFGADGLVLYSMEPSIAEFVIFAESGDVIVQASLDRELRDVYAFTVTATDRGVTKRRNSTTSLTVTIDDRNDNRPQCTDDIVVELYQPISVGDIVYQPTCSDKDVGLNADIKYSILSGNENFDFIMDSNSGRINVGQKPSMAAYILTCEAIDGGNPPLRKTFTVEIRLLRNMEFLNLPISIEVNETNAVAIELYDVDSFGYPGPITYALVSGNTENVFAIDHTTGSIYNLKSIDRERTSGFNLTIEITDTTSAKSERSYIVFRVADINDNAPKFDKSFYVVRVLETVAKGHIVIPLRGKDSDVEERNHYVSYTLANSGEGTFKIDQNGTISTVTDLNRETRSSYVLSVMVRDHGLPMPLEDSARVFIDVVEYNEHPPIFDVRSGEYEITLSEYAPTGDAILDVNATDDDKSRLTYEITYGNDGELFVLDESNGKLHLVKPLDYESHKTHTLEMKVTNTEKEEVFGKITVIVLDENDNDPVCPNFVEQVELPQVTVSDTEVISLVCADKDGGSNGDLTYYLESGNRGNHFKLDGASVRTASMLNSQVTHYSLVIGVIDNGDPVRSTKVVVNVHVILNDPPPKYLVRAESVTLPENYLVGNVVYDSDATMASAREGHNGTLMYELINGNEAGKFSVIPHTGEILLNAELDYDNGDRNFSLKIRASNRKNPLSVDFQYLTILVTDVNDNYPRFPENHQRINMNYESGFPSSFNGPIAVDNDEGANGEVTYSLSGSLDFSINNLTGVITAGTSLLAKDGDVILLKITASDNGLPRKETSQIMYVKIVDNTNRSPVFSSEVYYADVREDVTDAVIFVITAVDHDAGNNGRLKYAFTGGNVGDVFELNHENGYLSVRGSLDREILNNYNLGVVATDFGSPPLNSNTTVHVKVLDANDHEPKFEKTPYTKTLGITAAPLTSIINITVIDKDIGAAGETTCKVLEDGNERNLFFIDNSNEIKTTSSLITAVGQHDLTVECSDYGDPVKTSQVPVKIKIENDRPFPNFADSIVRLELSENQTPGITVYDANATESGATDGTFGSLRYEIINDKTGLWSIDPRTGKISANARLDRDKGGSQKNVLIRAKDAIDASKSDTMHLKIDLTDINDNPPVFSRSTYSVEVVHGDTGPVVTVLATDADIGANAEISYVKMTGKGESDFTIDPTSGEISTAVVPDIRRQTFYALTVTARDNGDPYQEATALVSVTVIPVENTAPYFTLEMFEVYVREDASKDSVVFALTAVDRDSGDSGIIDYSIVSGDNDNVFNLNKTTGVITLASPVDREFINEYTLKVAAIDRGTPPLSTETIVKIYVTDVNDNQPVFQGVPYMINIDTSVPIGRSIGYILATDDDDDNHGLITYSVLGGDSKNLFNIHSFNGDIRTSSDLSHRAGTYNMVVSAKDSGIEPRSAIVTVKIVVKELSQNRPPVFTQSLYNIDVQENTVPNTAVFRAVAADPDFGERGKIRYGLSGYKDTFFINPNNGYVFLIQKIDREERDEYKLIITATDFGDEPETSTTQLVVSIIDENDNWPKFTESKISKTLYPDLVDGTEIIDINATDADIGENSKVFYNIASGKGPFLLNSLTGKLVTVGDLRSKAGVYNLVVTATDSGIPPKSSTIDVRIQIISEVPDQTYTIEENLPRLSSLGFVATSVPGSTKRTFEILSGSGVGKFKITSDGEIVTSREIDAEDGDELYINVRVSDNNIPPASEEFVVKIKVNDENDNTPRFSRSSYVTSIPDRQAPDTVALNFDAFDQDISESKYALTYTMSPPEILETFTLDSSKRQILVKTPPVYKSKSQYRFKLTVTDSGIPPLFSHADVTINIDPSPVVSPTLSECSTSVYITADVPYNAERGTTVHVLSPSQFGLDQYNVTAIRYITIQGEKAPFQIGEISGKIVVSNADSMYKHTRYIFWVVAQASTDDAGRIGALAMVRLDTFIPNDHVIIVVHSLDPGALDKVVDEFAVRLSDLVSGIVKVWKTTSNTSKRKKRDLLAAAESFSYLYAVVNPSSEKLTGMESAKIFASQSALLSSLPLSTIQTGVYVNYSVIDVLRHDVPEETTNWASTTVGIAVITIVVLAFIFLIAIIVFYFWCTSPRNTTRSESVESLKKADHVSFVDSAIGPFAPIGEIKESMFPHYHRVPSPKPHRTVTLGGVQYDGRAHDPVQPAVSGTGKPYVFNSGTGHRLFVTEDELDLYLAKDLPHKTPPPCVMHERRQPHLTSSVSHSDRDRTPAMVHDGGTDSDASEGDGERDKQRLENSPLHRYHTIDTFFKPLPENANRLKTTMSDPDLRTPNDPDKVVDPEKTMSITPKTNARTFRALTHFWKSGRNKTKSRKPQVIMVKNDTYAASSPRSTSLKTLNTEDYSFFSGPNSSQIPYAVEKSSSLLNKLSASPRLKSKIAPTSPTSPTTDVSGESRADSAYSSVVGESYT